MLDGDVGRETLVTGKDIVLHACRQLDTKMTVVYVEVDEHVSDS